MLVIRQFPLPESLQSRTVDLSQRPTFTIVVPTVGRASLRAALASVAGQLEAGDELIVVCNDDGDFGNSARNSAIERSRGSHIVFLDDDDEYLPGAFDAMREYAGRHPDRVLLFLRRFGMHGNALFGLTGDSYPASVGGVFPNLPGKVGRFAPASESLMRDLRPRYPDEPDEYVAVRAGDHEFMRSTLELRGDEPLCLAVATIVSRPERSRWKRLRYRLRLGSRLRRPGKRGRARPGPTP